jgi:hypothetical protein|tara:strand:- start:417 stop:608 length:192 start_codon:yes stop_codon:yes gene_type:complete
MSHSTTLWIIIKYKYVHAYFTGDFISVKIIISIEKSALELFLEMILFDDRVTIYSVCLMEFIK